MLHKGLSDELFGASGTWSLRQCPQVTCGLVWLDPMPIPEDVAKAYHTYYTHGAGDRTPRESLARRLYLAVRDGYARREYGYSMGVGPSWQSLLSPLANLHPGGVDVVRATVMFLPAPPSGGRLIEVGCGDGAVLARMSRLGWDVEGVDFDPVATARARARGLTVYTGDIASLGLPEAAYDAVFLGHVLEHVPDPVELLRACRALLKPGGVVVAITPNTSSWGHRTFGPNWRGLEVPRHLHLFGPQSVLRCFESAGLGTAHVRTLVRGAGYILTESDRLSHLRAKSAGRGRKTIVPHAAKWLYYQLGERVRVALGRPDGEELLVIAG
jgi:2-polyprenyl-3-methyl-5-hydroxy-6-metoxy-1,4-benzoquinol methylase